jgi:hypothetical protein
MPATKKPMAKTASAKSAAKVTAPKDAAIKAGPKQAGANETERPKGRKGPPKPDSQKAAPRRLPNHSGHAALAENLVASLEKVNPGTTPDLTRFPDDDENGNITVLFRFFKEMRPREITSAFNGPYQPLRARMDQALQEEEKEEATTGESAADAKRSRRETQHDNPPDSPRETTPEREAKQFPLRAAYSGQAAQERTVTLKHLRDMKEVAERKRTHPSAKRPDYEAADSFFEFFRSPT